ncbi:MAG: c-type cytochrome [Paracoccaceae bacterium]
MKHARTFTALGVAAVTALATVAYADGHSNPAVGARKSVMALYGFNIGQLGAMAKGDVEYNADAAVAAANNIVLMTQVNQSAMWPAGTDSASYEGSRALPAIWEDFGDVSAKGQALADAALAMQAAAGMDLASLQGAMGALGGACGACHKAYRAPK